MISKELFIKLILNSGKIHLRNLNLKAEVKHSKTRMSNTDYGMSEF